MAISRLRLRITLWFALAFVVGVLALELVAYGVVRHQADTRLTQRLETEARGLLTAVHRELADSGRGNLIKAVKEALAEWPGDEVALAVFGPNQRRLGELGPEAILRVMPQGPDVTSSSVLQGSDSSTRFHFYGVRDSALPALVVVAGASTAALRAEGDRFASWLEVTGPLAILLAVVGGYILSRQALAPMGALSDAVSTIRPEDLERRLPVHSPPDELDYLAGQFNSLMERVRRGQLQNRQFLSAAAHQLRTPLTVIVGESSLRLDRPRSEEEQLASLRRIQVAAHQMVRRVDELLLLARAEAGEAIEVARPVDLDEVAFEAVDLMRGRAHALGRSLELGEFQPVTIRGNGDLLREAILEIIENALRHGRGPSPVRLEVQAVGDLGVLEVTSGGPPFAAKPLGEDGWSDQSSGLGLLILRRIAQLHHGELRIRRREDLNSVALLFHRMIADGAPAADRPEALSEHAR